MLFLGLLLLAATAAFTGLAIAGNLSGGPDYTVSVLDNPIVTMSTLAIFASGLALALLFCLGLATALTAATHRYGSRRSRAHRTAAVDERTGPDTRL